MVDENMVILASVSEDAGISIAVAERLGAELSLGGYTIVKNDPDLKAQIRVQPVKGTKK